MDLQNLPKLQRTVEFSLSKLVFILKSKEHRYSSIWDHSVNHDKMDIHSFSFRYDINYDDFELVIMDIDSEPFQKYRIDKNTIEFSADAWNNPNYIERNYRTLNEEQHFQESTIREIMPYEMIELFSTAMDTCLKALGDE